MTRRALRRCPGCPDGPVGYGMVTCRGCWRRVPHDLRAPMLEALAMGPTAPAYMDAAGDVAEWLRSDRARRTAAQAVSV